MLSSDMLHQYGVVQILGTGTALSRNQPLQNQIAIQYSNIPFRTVEEGDAAFGAALAALS